VDSNNCIIFDVLNKLKLHVMKIELKNVKFSESLSEETNAFTADIFVNNVKCGYAKNNGQGGCTDIRAYSDSGLQGLLDMCENELRVQPQINIGSVNDPFMVKSNLENVVDQMFEQWLKDKEKKKFEKKMINHIMWGVPNVSS
jgi:hypothetical protein